MPEVTVYFWVIKILCTTVGESFADYLNETLGFGLTNTTLRPGGASDHRRSSPSSALNRYVPGIYWLAVVLISVVGTLITDNLTDVLGVPLWMSTMVFAVAPGRRLRHLVRPRAHAVDPHHRHHRARGVLLADHPLHVRARHRGRRPVAEPRTRLPRRHACSSPLASLIVAVAHFGLKLDAGPLVLARLHPDPPARRLHRRPALPEHRRRRPRPGDHRDQRVFLAAIAGTVRVPDVTRRDVEPAQSRLVRTPSPPRTPTGEPSRGCHRPSALTGVAGWAVHLMETLGVAGAAIAIALENVFPPLPSEIILPLAGFTASQGSFGLVEAIIWTTVGSVVGALVLYLVGALIGRDRTRAADEQDPAGQPRRTSTGRRRSSSGTGARPCSSDAWCPSSGA